MADPYSFALHTTASNAPQLSYRDVSDLFEQDKVTNPAFSGMTLPEYVAEMKKRTGGSPMFDAGLSDSFMKRLSVGVDRGLESTGLPQMFGGAFGALGSTVGLGPEFEHAGESFPRALTNMLPILLTGGAATPAVAASAAAGTGALSALDTYEKSDSGKLALLSGLTAGFMPAVAGRVGQLGIRGAGSTLVDESGRAVAETLGQRLAGYGAAQAGAFGFQEASHQIGSVWTQGKLDLTAQHFVESAVSQLPFLAFDAGTGAFHVDHAAIRSMRAAQRTREVNAKVEQALGEQQTMPFTPDVNISPTVEAIMRGDFTKFQTTAPTKPAEATTFVQPQREYVQYNGKRFEKVGEEVADRVPIARLRDLDTGAPVTAPLKEITPTEFNPNVQAVPGAVTDVTIKQSREMLKRTLFGEPIERGPLVLPSTFEQQMRVGPTGRTPEEQAQYDSQYNLQHMSSYGEGAPDMDVSRSSEAFSPGDFAGDYKAWQTFKQKTQKAPVTPEVKAQVEQLIAEKDFKQALKRITKAYKDVFAPMFGIKDIALERISDQDIQKQIKFHMDNGASLDDAINFTLEGVKNSLVLATESQVKVQHVNAGVTEGVTGPAVRLKNGQIVKGQVGQIHASIYETLTPEQRQGLQDGFYTNTGRYVSREEAATIVKKAKQLKEGKSDSIWNLESGHYNPAPIVDIQKAMGSTVDARLAPAVENLRGLDDAWNALGKDKASVAQRAELYGTKSPLEKIAKWMDNLIKGNGNYQKYAEIDQYLLISASQLAWKDGQWYNKDTGAKYTEDQARKYLRNGAEMAYRAAVKKESGGDEVQTQHGEMSNNEANALVDKLNNSLKPDDGFTYAAQEIKEGPLKDRPTGKSRIVKQYKLVTSADENFTRSADTEPTSLDQYANQKVSAKDFAEMAWDEDAGTVVLQDFVQEMTDEVRALRDEAGDATADAAMAHLRELFQHLDTRLEPWHSSVENMGVRESWKLVPRVKIMMQHLTDARFSSLEGKVNWQEAFPTMQEALSKHPRSAELMFTDSKQAENWWNNTGKKFLFAQNGWFARQPEIQTMNSIRNARLSPERTTELMGQVVREMRPVARAPRMTASDTPLSWHVEKPSLTAIADDARLQPSNSRNVYVGNIPESQFGLGLDSLTFAREVFLREGHSPAQSEAYAQGVDRFVKAMSVFPQAQRALLERSTELDPGQLGQSISKDIDGKWRALIQIAHQNYGAGKVQSTMYSIIGVHEGWHVVENAAMRGHLTPNQQFAFDNVYALSDAMTPTERLTLLNQYKHLIPEGSNEAAVNDFNALLQYSSQNSREFVSTLAAIHALGVADATPARISKVREALTFGDGAIARLMQVVYNAASTIVRGVKSLFASQKRGFVNDERLTTLQENVLKEMHENLSVLARTPDEVAQAVKTLTALDAYKPETMENSRLTLGGPEVARTGDSDIDGALDITYARIFKLGDKREIPKGEAAVMDFMQMAQLHGPLKPIAVEALAFQGMARNASEDALSPMFQRDIISGKVTVTEAHKSVQRIAASDKMLEVLRDQTLDEQTAGAVWDPAKARSYYASKGLDAKQQADMFEARQALSNMGQRVAAQITQFSRWQLVHSAARVLMAGSTTPYKKALDAAERLTALTLHAGQVQPLPAGVDPVMLLSTIPTEFGIAPEKIAAAQGMLGDLVPHYKTVLETVSNRPEFITEQRFGRYSATYSIQGQKVHGRVSADSRSELEAKIENLQKDPNNTNFDRFDNSDQHVIGLNRSISNAFSELGKAAFKRAVAVMPVKEAQAAEEAFTAFSTAMEKELTARGISKFTQERKFAPGREQINMLENMMRYVSTVPYALSKTWLKDRASVVLLDPQFEANPSAKQVGEQHIKNILAVDSPWSAKAREWTFTYYLGANLSSGLIETAQPLMTVPAQLIRGGSTFGGANKLLGQAFAMVTKGIKNKTYEDPFINNVIYQLEKGGLLDAQTTGYFFDYSDMGAVNLGRAFDGKITPLSVGRYLGNKVAHLASLSRNLYSRATSVSSRVSAVAGALRAKEMVAEGKLAPEGVYDFVSEFLTLTAPGTAGRAGRPVGLNSASDAGIRSAVNVATTLQNFTITMTSMFYRMTKEAFQSKSLTSQQTKAAATLFATQLVAAGVLGLPGVGTAIAIANAAFPEYEIKKNIREGFASLGGDDAEIGKLYSDLAMRGLPTVMSGVDVSTRLGLSNMLGVSSYDGFAIENLLGAPGGIINNLWEAQAKARQGKWLQAAEQASPTSIKNIIRLYRNGGDVRGPNGELIYEPNAAEQVAMAVGFTPKRVADMRELDQLTRQQDEVAKAELTRFYNELAEQLGAGDMNSVRQALLERERAQPDEFNAAEGLKVVIKRMQEQKYPEDPMRGGPRSTMNDRAHLLSTYNLPSISPSESMRVNEQNNIERLFGLFGGHDRSEHQRAALIDNLMDSKGLTRSQARAVVDKQYRRGLPQILR